MLFKGRLSRKFLYCARVRQLSVRFLATPQIHARSPRIKRQIKTPRNARTKAWKKLDRLGLRASLSFRGSPRHFRRSFLSCFRSHARFLHSFFPSPFPDSDISLVLRPFTHTACRIKSEERARMRKDVAPVGSAMKRTSRPALYRY